MCMTGTGDISGKWGEGKFSLGYHTNNGRILSHGFHFQGLIPTWTMGGWKAVIFPTPSPHPADGQGIPKGGSSSKDAINTTGTAQV